LKRLDPSGNSITARHAAPQQLEIDEHQGQGLRDAIMQLSSERTSNFGIDPGQVRSSSIDT
jgi:hypothetical protein